VKSKPILFSGPMVRAILDGRKTQTRRVVKQLLPENRREGLTISASMCPYGKPRYKRDPGDRLWVKESWIPAYFSDKRPGYRADWRDPEDIPEPKWKPSLFMPRWASRITLEITGVRVERVKAISEDDAKAEGVEGDNVGDFGIPCKEYVIPFADLWDSINGKKPGRSWADNPWVWVIEFERVKP